MHLEQLKITDLDWSRLESFPDRTVYQTEQWLRFLGSTQTCDPIVAAVKEGDETIGYFTGASFRKFGLKMLGSPCPGWSTSYMGFNLAPDVDRADAVGALVKFAFREFGCLHLELMDRDLTMADVEANGLIASNFPGYEIDLTKSEDELFGNMDSDYRRCTRNAAKNGVTVEECTDLDFADDYYDQLLDVFGRRGLRPTYQRERVRALLEHMMPAGMLLALRARDRDGRCVATGIFLGHGQTAFYWGGASWRKDQILRPNHAIQWHAIRYWKSRGMSRYDMGGGGRYKANFGGRPILVPWARTSKYKILERPRQLYRWLARRSQKLSTVGNSTSGSD